jgi:hydrogenase maturation protein HypF
MQRLRVVVRGQVQGVGFRPFLHRQATRLGLSGWVRNEADAVALEAEGAPAALETLLTAVRETPPPAAQVAGVETVTIPPLGETGFSVCASAASAAPALRLPLDRATCADCLAELFDPANRRFGHAFIACTACGPRYSMIESLPYERARTAMRHFPICAACAAEYSDPGNRRFHAEPIACPECGPRLALWSPTGASLSADSEAIAETGRILRGGGIVAAKGIGGFHLLADARDERAVQRLRAGKRREGKPFAVMMADLEALDAHCAVSSAEAAALTGPAAPIVLLRQRGRTLAPSVTMESARLGAMLPYSPIHHLLMRELGFPLVATSGNIAEEPILIEDLPALRRLGHVADAFLVHDRPILRPLDDSVLHVVAGEPQLLRRARGFAPLTVPVAGMADGILGYGAQQKGSIALSVAGHVVLGQHLGEQETPEAHALHRRATADLAGLLGVTPRVAVRDAHPDYGPSRAAERSGLRVAPVQHHLAHAVACLAEHGLEPPALAIAWDGTGLGTDGTIWGGEALLLERTDWRRAAWLLPFRLPGGDAAAREPRRAAIGMLHAVFGEEALAMDDLAPVAAFTTGERRVLAAMLARGTNAPPASSVGRLFDGVAALLGLQQRTRYEGEAAMALEALATQAARQPAYAMPIMPADDGAGCVLDWRPALRAIILDRRQGRAPAEMAAAFHEGLAAAAAALARRFDAACVALTGGCFQNAFLTEACLAALRADGRNVLWHRAVPPNDAGVALGQVVWAAWAGEGGGAACASRSPV